MDDFLAALIELIVGLDSESTPAPKTFWPYALWVFCKVLWVIGAVIAIIIVVVIVTSLFMN